MEFLDVIERRVTAHDGNSSPSSSRGLTTGSKFFTLTQSLSSLRRQGSNFLGFFDMDSCVRRNDNLIVILDTAIKSRYDEFTSPNNRCEA